MRLKSHGYWENLLLANFASFSFFIKFFLILSFFSRVKRAWIFLIFQGNFASRCTKYFRTLSRLIGRAKRAPGCWAGNFALRFREAAKWIPRNEKLALYRLQEEIFADEDFLWPGQIARDLSSMSTTLLTAWCRWSSTTCRPALVTYVDTAGKVASAGRQVVDDRRPRSSTGPGRSPRAPAPSTISVARAICARSTVVDPGRSVAQVKLGYCEQFSWKFSENCPQ